VLPESLIEAADACQFAVPFISLSAYLPQWTRIVRTRSSAAISARSWAAWSFSSAFALFYAVVQLLRNGTGWALVLATSLGLVFVLFTLYLVLRFRPGKAS
jgi:uncharacterized protein with PQ loop repeat